MFVLRCQRHCQAALWPVPIMICTKGDFVYVCRCWEIIAAVSRPGSHATGDGRTCHCGRSCRLCATGDILQSPPPARGPPLVLALQVYASYAVTPGIRLSEGIRYPASKYLLKVIEQYHTRVSESENLMYVKLHWSSIVCGSMWTYVDL